MISTNDYSEFYKRNAASLKLKNRINSYTQFKEELAIVKYAARYISEKLEQDAESFFIKNLNDLNFMVIVDDVKKQKVCKIDSFIVVIDEINGEFQLPKDYFTDSIKYEASSFDDFAEQIANNSKLNLIAHNNHWKMDDSDDSVPLTDSEIDAITQVVKKEIYKGEIRGTCTRYFYSKNKELGYKINMNVV